MRHRHTSAFTLFEALIALSITAMLLASVATVFNASLTSYRENDTLAEVTQTARVTLDRIMRDVRRADDVNYTATQITIFPVSDGSGLQQIQYDYVGGTVWYRKTVNGATTSYPVLTGTDTVAVVLLSVTGQAGKDYNNVNCTKAVTLRLDLKSKNQTLSLTASGSPRRNQVY